MSPKLLQSDVKFYRWFVYVTWFIPGHAACLCEEQQIRCKEPCCRFSSDQGVSWEKRSELLSEAAAAAGRRCGQHVATHCVTSTTAAARSWSSQLERSFTPVSTGLPEAWQTSGFSRWHHSTPVLAVMMSSWVKPQLRIHRCSCVEKHECHHETLETTFHLCLESFLLLLFCFQLFSQFPCCVSQCQGRSQRRGWGAAWLATPGATFQVLY